MSIKVQGTFRLRGQYEVTIDMTEEQFDSLSEREQNDHINDSVDWKEWLDNADIDDVDVDDIKETQ